MMRFLRPFFIALVLIAAAGGAYYYYTAILNPGADTPAASAGPMGGAPPQGMQASGRPQGAGGSMPPGMGQGAARGGPPPGMGQGAARGGPPPGMGGSMGGGRPMPVVVAPVTEEMFGDRLEAIGTTFANESITVSAKVPGIIRRVDFDDGQYVEKGVEIAAIDAGEQDARLNVELANLDEQRKELDRIEGLAKSNNVSQSRRDQQISALRKAEANVAAARARVADYRIAAPFSGVLGTRRVSVGALVSPGTLITTLDDISTIKLDFAVPENFLATLRPGLAIEATTTAYDNEVFKGEVVSVDSRIDVATRSVGIRAAISNPSARLKPGMLMVVDLIKDNRLSLMIPEQALLPENTKNYVFIVGADNTADRVEVTIGRRRFGSVEILDGVAVGDLVIVEGGMDMRPRAKVEILNQDKVKEGPPSADMRGSMRSPG